MKIRRVVTLTLLLSFLVPALSGLVLFGSPQRRVAHWSGWAFLGLGREVWAAVHQAVMALFLGMAMWHLVLNWRAVTGYLKDRAKRLRVVTRESAVAGGIVALCLAGALAGLPPFGPLAAAGEDVKAW